MADIPSSDALVGASVTEAQFKDNLTKLVKAMNDVLIESIATSKDYTDVLGGAVLQFKSQIDSLANYGGSGNIVPFFTDSTNKILLGYDTVNDKIAGAGLVDDAAIGTLTSETLGKKSLAQSNSSTIVPVMTDAANRVLLGYDITADKIIGAFDIVPPGRYKIKPLDAALKVITKAVNHFIFYGQSLGVGALGTPVLSTTQPFNNLTFNGGPRGNGDFATAKLLIEDAIAPAPDGGSNRGETPCSGAANYASLAAYRENAVAPANHVIFASAAGRGGTAIASLKKGSSWYNTVFLNHVTSAYAINNNSCVSAMAWVQGEQDAYDGTTYETYKALLAQLQIDAETDIKAINIQSSPLHVLTYQLSYKAATAPQIAKALYDLTRENAKFHYVTPTYIFPHQSSDQVHLTNVGYKLMGAYFGRAYKQLVHDGIKPHYLEPIAATIKAAVVTVSFNVPTLPLLLDTVNLAATTDMGFAVYAGGVKQTINSLKVVNNTVQIILSTTPSGAITVRYGLDYLGTGLSILNGASGNLRDSTSDKITISGIEYILFHACPHVELTVITEVI